MAKLNFYYGAMTCGKSERFISAARNYKMSGLPIVTAMPAIGMRETGFTTSRNGEKWPIDITTYSESDSTTETDLYAEYHRHIGEFATNVHALFVDEAQFLTESQVEALEQIAKIDKTSVIAYGLRSNVQRKLFDGSKRLIELADKTEKIITMCKCGQQAEYNGRFINSIFTLVDGEKHFADGTLHVGEPIVWIDTPESRAHYEAICADCYLSYSARPDAILV